MKRSKRRLTEKYIRSVSRHIDCSSDAKLPGLDRLRVDVNSFVDSHPGCTFDDVVAEAGGPEKAAQEISVMIPTEAFIRYRLKQVAFRIVTAVALFLLMLYAGFAFFLTYEEHHKGQYQAELINGPLFYYAEQTTENAYSDGAGTTTGEVRP